MFLVNIIRCISNKLKLTYVIPAHKGNSKMSIGNYRPISIIPIFGKIFEKLIYARFMSFLNKECILYDHQFGFRSKRSTDLAILDIHRKLIHDFENNNFACCMFLDFAKAFDTINHNILLQKLNAYGVRGIAHDWFKLYLTDRKQMLKLGNIFSESKTIMCGVPQGNVLGPLLFLIYVNDMYISTNTLDSHLFADDTALYLSDKDINNLEEKINTELLKITEWLEINKLTLNVSKSNFVIFSVPQKKAVDIKIYLCNKQLEKKDYGKYLSVYIDKHLSWKKQIEFIKRKLCRAIGIISKLRCYTDTDLLKSIYYLFFYPYVIYGILNCGCAHETALATVERRIKKVVRVMCFKEAQEHSIPYLKN